MTRKSVSIATSAVFFWLLVSFWSTPSLAWSQPAQGDWRQQPRLQDPRGRISKWQLLGPCVWVLVAGVCTLGAIGASNSRGWSVRKAWFVSLLFGPLGLLFILAGAPAPIVNNRSDVTAYRILSYIVIGIGVLGTALFGYIIPEASQLIGVVVE